MVTLSPFFFVIPFATLCLMLSAIEKVGTTHLGKLALQVVLLMTVIAWLAQTFHVASPLERMAISCWQAFLAFDLIAWVSH